MQSRTRPPERASSGWNGRSLLRTRLGAGLAAMALHLTVIILLLRAFAANLAPLPNPPALTVIAPPPPYTAIPPRPGPHAGGAPAAPAPHTAQAPIPTPITLADQPLTTGGDGVTAGSGKAGQGTGSGTGVGQGTGQGAQKISGDILASDYPEASRLLRIGDYVIVALTIASDGHVSACRIHRPSRDAEADAITCRLARARFRFRPATDATGHAIETEFGWRQAWHY